MARQASTKRGRAAARRGHRLDGTRLDFYTATWLTRRFLRVAGGEARRTAKGWRKSASKRAGRLPGLAPRKRAWPLAR
jgi:hypothetical protein